MSSVPSPAAARPMPSSLVARLVFGLDAHLRQARQVIEYSTDPQCLLRIERTTAPLAFSLSDGTVVRAGDPLVSLHFWNEHIFAMETPERIFSWSNRMRHAVARSLGELSRFLDSRAEYDDFAAICGDLGLATPARGAQVVRMCRAYGFEPVEDPRRLSLPQHLHRAGENALGLMFALAVNPLSARLTVLARGRALVAISRAGLRQRYGRISTEAS